MKRYKGYFNYYIGSTLKTYHFNMETALFVLAIENLLKLRATTWVGSMVVEQSGDLYENEEIIPIALLK